VLLLCIGGLRYLALPIHAAHKIVRDDRSAALTRPTG
jgi:hypothetical protein